MPKIRWPRRVFLGVLLTTPLLIAVCKCVAEMLDLSPMAANIVVAPSNREASWPARIN